MILTDTGGLLERVSYDPYGEARHHRFGDVDGDGDRDSTDRSIIAAIYNPFGIGSAVDISHATYNADADLDRDGDIDATDYNLANPTGGGALPKGVLSDASILTQNAPANQIGYCGYVYNGEAAIYTARFRHYDPYLGRWLERDPAGYIDSMSLNAYGPGRPLLGADPYGLNWWEDYKYYFKKGWEPFSEPVHYTLDVAGLIPIVGDLVADGANAAIYWLEGRYIDAGISGAAMIPFFGSGATAAKWGKRLLDVLKGRKFFYAVEAGGKLVRWVWDGVRWVKDKSRPIREATRDGCFVAGTLVLTASGPLPIDEVEPGCEVWSYNAETDEWELSEVLATQCRDYTGDVVTLQLAIEDGDEALEITTITCTGGHPFWVTEGMSLAKRPACSELPLKESAMTPSGRWTEARWLRLGDHFLTKTGKSATVVGLIIRLERVKVYNLQVKNLQLYAVGGDGVLVHNSGSALDAFGERARRLGWKENPNRPGSWGIYENGKFVERGRLDPASPSARGWRGKDHIHIDGCKEHLPPDTPLPGE